MFAIETKRSSSGVMGDTLAIVGRLYSNRWFMGLLMIVALTLYLWGANHSLDYPQYDESAYYARAYYLLHGDFSFADISNPGTSPLYVLYYALWYLALRTPFLYPWVLPSCLFLLGISGYLLFSRIFHPTLAWALALIAVIGAAPVVTANANYYFGAAVLWLGLSLLDKRVYMRALGAFVVLLAVFVRPDYLLCLFAMLALLSVYEWRQLRQGKSAWRQVALSYGPVLLALIFTLYLFASVPAADTNRLTSAIPWSYNDYYNATYPQQFHGLDSYAHPWVIFQQDFGVVKQPRTVSATLIAMVSRPDKLGPYLSYEVTRLIAGFEASATQAYSWTYQPPFRNIDTLPGAQQVNWAAPVALALALLVLAVVCFFWLRAEGRLSRIQVNMTWLSAIALIALLTQIGPLLLINPHQRYFTIFPLLLLPIGIGLAIILARFALPAWSLVAPILLIIALVPHPFAVEVAHPGRETMAFIQANVPLGSTIVGAPLNSYDNYLSTEGVHYNMLEAPNYGDSVLVNAAEVDPTLRYVLLTSSYSLSTYDQWFADWQRNFPDLHWTLVAARTAPDLRLYALPQNAGVGQEIGYVTFLQRAAALHQDVSALPSHAALDLSASITWASANPKNMLKPQAQDAWDVHATAITMHPYYQGIDPRVASKVWTTLPASWSGRNLMFLATLPPWSAGYPAQGVKLTFTVDQSGYSKTFEVNNLAQQNWVPIVLPLPHFQGATTLTLTIAPRVSVNYCTTWVSFIGVAQ